MAAVVLGKRRPARAIFLATCTSILALPIGSASAQNYSLFSFIPEGPAPSIASGNATMSLDINQDSGTTSGAVQSVLVSPTSPGTLFIGTVNGGIWTTTDGGNKWTPLTDDKSSLSIGSMAYKADNTSTIFAGIGVSSNGAFNLDAGVAGRGGPRTGILVSVDGGKSWSPFADSEKSLSGKSVVGVAARGDVVVAATAEYNAPAQSEGYGLYRSVGGADFKRIDLPKGAATSLVGSGTTANPYYAAIAGVGVYSSDNNGANWKLLSGDSAPKLDYGEAARIAVGPNGAVAVAVYNQRGVSLTNGGKLARLYLAPDGASWRTLPAPPVTDGGQADTDLAIAIDPADPNTVYLGGDAHQAKKEIYLAIYRVTGGPNGSSSTASISNDGTSNGTTSHADARGFAFDASGQLLVASDGGIYVRTNPGSANGTWSGMNAPTLSLREGYGVAYDSVSKRLLVSSQDNGVDLQSLPRKSGFAALTTGDGVNAAVNDRTTPRRSILYSTVQNLGWLNRLELDSSGTATGGFVYRATPEVTFSKGVVKEKGDMVWNFNVGKDYRDTDFTDGLNEASNQGVGQLPFGSLFRLNRVDPLNIAIGTNYVYVTTDQMITSSSAPLTLLTAKDDKGNSIRPAGISALAYGTGTDVNTGALALAAGSKKSTAESDSGIGRLYFTRDVSGGEIRQVVNYGTSATPEAPPTSIVFDPETWQRFYVADGKNVWRLADTTGTSAFSITNALGNKGLSDLKITQPTALEFIDGNGVKALLVGGMRSDPGGQSPIAVAISRGGVLDAPKAFGAGLPNAVANLLSYNALADVLAVGLWGRGIWTLYDVTSYFPTADKLIYGLADNNSEPDVYYLRDGEKGARDLLKVGTGTLTVKGTADYTGSTTVEGGMMVVTGSIEKSGKSGLFVGANGTIAGPGTLPATTVRGTMAPGAATNTPTTINVAKGYVQQAGSRYAVLVNGPSSDRVQVKDKATLAGGTVSAQVQAGTFVPSQTYTILSAGGGVEGAFAGSNSNFPFLQPSLSYDGSNVFLTLTAGGFSNAAQTPAQAAVATALDGSVWQASGDYATVIGALSQLGGAQMPAVLTAVSGTNFAGLATTTVQGAQLFMSNFQSQAGGGAGQGNRIALAEACDVACDSTTPGQWGVWGGAVGGLGTVGANQPVGGVTYNLGGFAAGIDRRLGDNVLAGVTVGYTGGTQWVSGYAGQTYTNTVQAGLYGSFLQGPLYVDALAAYAYTGSQATRSIAIPGLATRVATSQAGVNQLFGQVEAGWRLDIGTAADAYVTPFARLQGYTGMQGAFSESGAQSLNLSVAAQTTYSLRTVFGAQLGGGIDLGWRERLALQLRAGWSHEYADTSRPVSATLAGAPVTPFTTYGIAPARDGALLGLSAGTAIAESTSVYLRYEGLFAGQDSSHALTAGVRMTW